MGYVYRPAGRRVYMMRFYVDGRRIAKSTGTANEKEARLVMRAAERQAARDNAEWHLQAQLKEEDARQLPRSLDGWCYVYFVRAGEHVKIGRAVDVAQRVRELQVGHPHPLALVVSVPAHAALELAIHRRFQHLRTQGEWFRIDDDLVAFIQALQRGANPIALLWGRQ